MIELVLFFVMGAAAIAGALAVVFARNPVYGALGLLGTLFSLGVIYVVNLAHLVAAVQIIVYAGAVLTLFLFVIMLIGVDKDEDTRESIPFHRPLIAGLAVIVATVAGGLVLGGRFDWVPTAAGPESPPNGTVEALAGRLFTDWVLAFEVTALLLTIAAAGAIALAFFSRDGSEPSE
ncbi:MAG: NADH-quinone oxidoreductase subunit J [Acidimicrobiia bacterium]|nr:NADH-quinone oxidoreductase subunit J [Acidimicrobiia bacterium]